jgi:hypothetical protein
VLCGPSHNPLKAFNHVKATLLVVDSYRKPRQTCEHHIDQVLQNLSINAWHDLATGNGIGAHFGQKLSKTNTKRRNC